MEKNLFVESAEIITSVPKNKIYFVLPSKLSI